MMFIAFFFLFIYIFMDSINSNETDATKAMVRRNVHNLTDKSVMKLLEMKKHKNKMTALEQAMFLKGRT